MMKWRIFLIVVVLVGVAAVLGQRRLFPPEGIRRFPKWNVPEPTSQQLAWQEMELGMFFHLGMPTYSGVVGKVTDPKLFNPQRLNLDQWMEAALAMGAKYAVLTAQHVDGFLAWQSDVYDYGVKQSLWRDGKGDLVEAFVDACRRHGIKPGIYLNLADNSFLGVKYPGVVADGIGSTKQLEYNRTAEKMVTEICSRYGELVEIWFDGGVLAVEDGGPDIASIIKRLQPNAMVLGGQSASTIRLSGGETGMVSSPCYYTARRHYSMGVGHPGGALWLPVECDSPVRKKQWFWLPDTDDNLFTVNELMEMYEGSVENNGNLLLNANPDPSGRIPDKDMELYVMFGNEIRKKKYVGK